MDSCLLKLLSRDMKTKAKNKDQPTKNHKEYNRKIKYYKKIKTMGNITPTMDPLSQKWIDGRYRSLIWYVMLTQVMSNLLPGFRIALECIRNNPKHTVLNKNATSLFKSNTPYKDKGTPQCNSLSQIPWHVFRLQISLKGNQSHLL